ncbi:MAG: transposase [Chloroflexi bacterium]|nr:transposase [Chloroflexota bacterium]
MWVTILYPTGETWTDASGHVRQQVRGEERVILAALAVWPDGRHYILHYEVAADESAATWKTFFAHLLARGLNPVAVQVVGSDGTKGLLEALALYVPQAASQRCTVHKVRGFERYLAYQNLPAADPDTGQPLTPEDARHQRCAGMSSEALDIFTNGRLPERSQWLDCVP